MRKRIALQGTAIVFAVLAGTLAWSAPAPAAAAGRASDAAAASATRQAVSVQRLLSSRVEWAARLARLLRAVDAPPVLPTVYGPQTIVDEPDPTSAHPTGAQPDHWPVPQERGPGDEGEPGLPPPPAQPF